jgi:hypothetical protein
MAKIGERVRWSFCPKSGGRGCFLSGFNRRGLASNNGLPGGTRTHDHLLRRQMLYPAELQGDAY